MAIRRNQQKARKSIVTTDVFCGVGGLTRGLLDAGISVVAGYDIDDACEFPYEHNNSPAKFFKKDVTELTGHELAKHYPKNCVRVLVGCAPCVTFSKYFYAVDNPNDPRWPLLDQFARLIRELKPDIVSMENVPELRHHDIFKRFLDTLRAEEFHFAEGEEKQIVYCPDYGMAQQRSRLVIVASRFGPIELIPPTHTKENYLRVKDVLSGLPELEAGEVHEKDLMHRCSRLSKTNLKRIKHSKPGGTWRDWPEELVAKCHQKKKGKSYPSVYGRMSWDEPAPTVTTQFYGFGNGRFGHPEQDRAISLREGAILQSFPSDYQFVEPDGNYCTRVIGRMIGNAVPVRLGEVVGKTIIQHLGKYEQSKTIHL
jgi:DNA (cytosine-5)-methyltransferase 1